MAAGGTFHNLPVDEDEEEQGPGDEEEEEEGEEEEEEEEEEVQQTQAQTQARPRTALPRVGIAAAPAPSARVNKKSRKGSKADARATRMPAAPTEPVWQEKDVELLWPEILRELGKPQGFYEMRSAYDVEVRALRLEPPPKMMVGRFEGSLCLGDATINPGDAFIEVFDDYITIPANMTTSVRFDVQFVWKGGPQAGTCFARGIMARPSASEVWRMRAARQREGVRRQNMGGGGQGGPEGLGGAPAQAMPGYGPQGYPPPQQPYGYPQQYPPQYLPQGYQPAYPYPYAPPQAQSQELSPAVQQLVSTLTEQLNVTRRELAESRGQPAPQPIPIPQATAQPAQPPQDFATQVAQGVVAGLRAVGLGAGASAAPPAPGAALGERLLAGAAAMTEQIIGEALKRTSTSIGMAMKAQSVAAGEPEPVGVASDESHAAEVVPVDNAKDSLPFQEITLEGKWNNGQPVVYTPAKEGQTSFMGVHPMGFITANPFVLEKLTEAASTGLGRIVETIADVAQRATTPGGPQVVRRTPSNAVDATVQEAVSSPPPPPPVDGEGESGSGWPSG
jgi:hypothetical protein